MSEGIPPTVEEFASRYPPLQPKLAEVFARRPDLWDAVVRLRDPDGEFRLGWDPIVEFLKLYGVETSESSVRFQWKQRQTS